MFGAPELAFTAENLNIGLFFKAVVLIVIVMYGIVSFFIYNKILALNRIVFFPPRTAANYVKTVAFIYFLMVVSLFLIALVIPN